MGENRFDLVVHVLNKGVFVHVALAAFDPILKTKLDTAWWKARRAFIGAAEVAGPDAGLDVLNATHSARVGLLPRLRLAFIRNLNRRAGRLNALAAEDRARELEYSPGLVRWLRFAPGGTLVARKWPPPPLVPGTHHHKIAVFDGAMSSDARFGEYLQASCVDEVAEAFGSRAAICSPVRAERVSASGRDTLCGSPIV